MCYCESNLGSMSRIVVVVGDDSRNTALEVKWQNNCTLQEVYGYKYGLVVWCFWWISLALSEAHAVLRDIHALLYPVQ